MIGDVPDFIRRMRAVLPIGWFAQQSLYLDAVLAGLGTAWTAIYALIVDVQLLSRLATVFGPFLDMASVDYFGDTLPRRPLESDGAFRLRIKQELLRPRATRSAISLVLTELTGKAPVIFEPARPEDTGGYSTGGVGYSAAGGWGNLNLPYASFVTVAKPRSGGIAGFAGYGTGGYSYYGNLAMLVVPVTEADICAAVTGVLPAGYVAWTRIGG